MDDLLTKSVLDYQTGTASLEVVRNQILVEAFTHLRRYRGKGEDEVSEFLLEFHGRIEGLLVRFRPQGVPFRHYLFRTLRWQWRTFLVAQGRMRQQDWLVTDPAFGGAEPDSLAEPSPAWVAVPLPSLTPAGRRRLVLLALKAAPYLDEVHLEAISHHTGVELAWLQACQRRLLAATDRRRMRRDILVGKRGEAYGRRLMAENEAHQESDPGRKRSCEQRANLYRSRLNSLSLQQKALSTAPTHLELATLLGIPKGTVDSGLYHVKKALAGMSGDGQGEYGEREK